MKQVFSIIRPNKYFETKTALLENNFPSMSVRDIIGRGEKAIEFQAGDGSDCINGDERPFVAKKMIEIFCRDEDMNALISVILKVNKTGETGDGIIFVVNVEEGVRIRTGEKDINAIM